MTFLYTLMPELVRYVASEMRARRLAFGAGLSLVAGVCLWLLALTDDAPGKALFQYVVWAQAAILLGYGTARTASSVMTERQEGTWDLQRLTPLAPEQLAFGKLLGAPLFAFFLALTLMPWSFASLVLPRAPEAAHWAATYVALAAATFLFLSVGLVVSAYSAESFERGSTATGALLGLLAFQAFTPVMIVQTQTPPFSFYGAPLTWNLMWAFTTGSLGVWAFAGAKWRIAKDLLQGPRWWRLPAFLAFTVWYQLGLIALPTRLSVLVPCLLVYMASILNGVSLDHWKQWLRGPRGAEFFHRAPVWLNGSVAFLALALLVSALPLRHPLDPDWRLYPLMQACFLVRDLAFLQWMRLGSSRRPEVAALISLAAAYAVPAVVVGVTGAFAWCCLYAPVPTRDASWLVNLSPGFLQAAAMGWALRAKLRRGLVSVVP